MKKMNSLNRFTMILCFIIIGGLFFYNRYMSTTPDTSKNVESKSEIERLIAKDLDDEYPSTAKEVLNLYCRYVQYIYNNNISDENLKSLIEQIRKMYHTELIDVNSLESQIAQIKEEINSFRKESKKITTCTVDTNADRRTVDGKECMLFQITFLLSDKNGYNKSFGSYIMALEDKDWKILGFKKISKDDPKEAIK